MARLLLVDDDSDACKILCRLLHRRGHETDCAASGEEALLRLRAAHAGQLPDVVLLDLLLPGRGGLDILQTIRGEPAIAGVPVVIYTAADEPERAGMCRAAGAAGYFVKGAGGFDDLMRSLSPFLRPRGPG